MLHLFFKIVNEVQLVYEFFMRTKHRCQVRVVREAQWMRGDFGGYRSKFHKHPPKNQVANGDDIENAHKLDWVPPDKGGLSASPLPVKLYVLWCRQFYKV